MDLNELDALAVVREGMIAILVAAVLLMGPATLRLSADDVAECPTAPFDDPASYGAAGFECAVGDLILGNFQFDRSSGAVTSDDITAGPVATDPFGLTLSSSDWDADPRFQSNEVWIRYTATVHDGSATTIESVLLDAELTVPHQGRATVAKYICYNGAITGDPQTGLYCADDWTYGEYSMHNAFSGAIPTQVIELPADLQTVGVLDYIYLRAGRVTATSLHFISNTFETYAAVPEPASVLFVGCGLIVLLVLWRGHRMPPGGQQP